MNPAAEVWDKVIALMGTDMTATTLNTWFDDATAVSLEESSFILYTPTDVYKRQLQNIRQITGATIRRITSITAWPGINRKFFNPTS